MTKAVTTPRREQDVLVRAVMFAHGSGSSRLSPRNRYVAQVLNAAVSRVGARTRRFPRFRM